MDYLLQEDGSKLLLEDQSGNLLLDAPETPEFWSGGLNREFNELSPTRFTVGPDLRW